MAVRESADGAVWWRRLWRAIILPLNAVALIVLLIWLLDTGRFPGIGGGQGGTVNLSGDFFSTSGEPLGAERGSGPGLGKPAPEFTLVDTSGQAVHLSDFRGKVVVLNFWATWCTPCRKEFPELVKTYDEGRGDVVVIGINMQENAEQVREFADEYGAHFPILIDPKAEAAEAYRLLGLPSSYFIDQQGVLREQHFGLLKREIIDDKIEKTRAAGLAAVP
jgi:peroxiredoxin